MKYKNAAEILSDALLREVQKYIDGDIMYIPKIGDKTKWGTESGATRYYSERNAEIRALHREGVSIEELSERFGLAYSTIKRILYR